MLPPTLVDTHAHLDDERFAGDLPQVLARAMAAGVRQVITIATTAATSRQAIQLAGQHQMLFASVGIQPNHVAEAAAGDWDVVVASVAGHRVVAVGETGLDRHWDFTPFPQQQEYFARHIELSQCCGLPLVIHCREAEADLLTMLREEFDRRGPIHGVMHSFSGDQQTADACVAMGLYLSFAGMATYKNAAALRSVARNVPADRILVETDSPYLVPAPLRGSIRRNEPAFVVHTAELLAAERGESLESFASQTTANARRLFRLPAEDA